MTAFTIRSFGCKTNQYESQGIREALLQHGLPEVKTFTEAKVAIFNSCAVTGRAGATCSNAILKALTEKPELRIILTGCAVDIHEKWAQKLNIEACFKNSEKAAIAAYLTSNLQDSQENRFAFSIKKFAGHTRAFLKIQDGCDNFCSYCIIPYARGNPVSRPIHDIIMEAQNLLDNGYTELVLTGINIGAYDYHGLSLTDLLIRLSCLDKLLRLRLGSIEPIYCHRLLLETVREFPVICPHLHLPLQSGDDRILRAMNRKYTVKNFLQTVELVREILTKPAITTDIIVGFPTEDQRSFEHTLQTVSEAKFSRSHIFTFSPREGTPAAKLPACAKCDITCRKQELTILTDKLATDFATSLIGSKESVILERKLKDENNLEDNSLWEGYCARYLRTIVRTVKSSKRRDKAQVEITGAEGAELRANALSL